MSARGRYPRGLSPAERWAKHRAELIRATAIASAGPDAGAISVDAVVKAAKKGRNTFYAHFGSVEQAIRAVDAAAIRAVSTRSDAALERAATPREKLRAMADSWLEAVDAEPELLLASLSNSPLRRPALARDQLLVVLGEAHAVGLVSGSLDADRVAAAVGAFESVVRRYAEGRMAKEQASRLAVDVLLRIFR